MATTKKTNLFLVETQHTRPTKFCVRIPVDREWALNKDREWALNKDID